MKNRYWALGLCILVLVLVLVSACGGGKATTTVTSTATSTKTATATATQAATATKTATATATQTAIATKTTTATATSGGGAGGSLSDILGKAANIASMKYEMSITAPGSETIEATIWQKMPKMREEMTIQGTTTVVIFDMDEKVMYTYMPDQNIAMKTTLNTSMIPEGNAGDASKILDYNPKIEGTETIDGKSCTVITWDVPGAGSMKEWVWTDKGFPLKMETTANGKTTVIEFKNIDFSDIPDSVFELPEGVNIIDSGG